MSALCFLKRFWWCSAWVASGLLALPIGQTHAQTSAAPTANVAARVGTFKHVSGLVWIERHGVYVHPKIGEGWLAGDRLHTGVDGAAVLNLRDGTLITLAHGVRLELDSLRVPQGVQREGFALNLLQGSLRVISGVIAQINPSLFQVKTPSATMGVRGTDFVTQTPARWWPWPSTRVTLFPEEDGRPSALVVQGPGGSQTLDQPYQRATSSLNGPNQASQTSARAVFWFMPDMGSFKVPPATKVNLYFEAGGVQLTPDSQTAFSQLVKSFKGRSDMDIMVIGHSDRAGDDESNEALSLQRAQAIGQTLTEQGFSADQVQAFGMGERRPLKPTEDGVAEALNRRVELVVR